MTRLLDGALVARAIRAEVTESVAAMRRQIGRAPGLAAVLVGDDSASQVYVGSKAKACSAVGIASRTVALSAAVVASELLQTIDDLNRDPNIDGILVQLPLPPGLPPRQILERVDPEKDVDGFHSVNVGRLWLDEPGLVPATPAGILELLRRSEVPLAGRRAVVVGRSAIVGKPLAGLLLREHCTVTLCHSHTRDLAAICREAEILVAALGQPAAIGPDHVRADAVVIDVGIHRISDAETVERLFPGDLERRRQLTSRGYTIVGDVDFSRVAPRVSAITPVPGGVGPLTVAMLLANTLAAARLRLRLAAEG